MEKTVPSDTTLNVVQIDRNSLPPRTAWIEANNVADAYEQMNDRVLHGPDIFAVWVPPRDTEPFASASDFFYQSAGKLYNSKTPHFSGWGLDLHDNDNVTEQFDQHAHNDGCLVRDAEIDPAKIDAAKNLMYQWHECIARVSRPSRQALRVESSLTYHANPLSYDIHADGRANSKGFRILFNLHGDGSFLYDSTKFNKAKNAIGLTVFEAKESTITAWDPPEGSVVMLPYVDMKEDVYAAHSAKSQNFVKNNTMRVLGKINALLPS